MQAHTAEGPFPARRTTRAVRVGAVTIGGGAPISVQSMAKCPTTDVQQVLEQTRRVLGAGGQIMRVAVPDEAAAEAVAEIVNHSPLPIVADIHFRADLGRLALEAGVHKLRVNPGNISRRELEELAGICAERGVAMRIGVNAGSLERRLLEKHGGATARALAESALEAVRAAEAAGLREIVVSIKAADVARTVAANELFAAETDVPLHVGITEAGPGLDGIVKSAVGIGILLARGLGDTLRVSLTGPPEDEVRAGRSILRALGLTGGPVLVSCPVCGRAQIDVAALAEQVRQLLDEIDADIVVAVMGCEVNGPGEAREADVGIAGGRERAVIFRKGRVVRTVDPARALEALREEILRALEEAKS